ncbi:cyclin-dependent kinase [Tanacetum coccineum]|uniref:Cyclin-dependent kinase n=1 Tax=Tanacetum coccineum TaxID=301880 RepID=A0ABQ5HWW9_9ASTR
MSPLFLSFSVLVSHTFQKLPTKFCNPSFAGVSYSRSVTFCHAHGVLQRDLKLHNLLLDRKTLMVKIRGLGLAQAEALDFAKKLLLRDANVAYASTSPNLKFTVVVANDVPLEGETKEDNQILLLKSRKLSLFFVSDDEAECSGLLYAEDKYHASKTPLLQRLKVQGDKIDPKDVVIAGPKHKDPNNECSVIDLQDSGSKNKLKQQNLGIKQVNRVASVLGPSSSSSFKNGKR